MGDKDTENDGLPYRAEYAKSGKSSCKECKDKIEKGELRLAIMVPFKVEKIPNWYHLKCFFIKHKPKVSSKNYYGCKNDRGRIVSKFKLLIIMHITFYVRAPGR